MAICAKVKVWCSSLLLVCGLMACSAAETPRSAIKIANGVEIDQSSFPEVVFLTTTAGVPVCTGTFIAPDTVLTAAHCTRKSSDVNPQTFEVGGLALNLVRVDDVINKVFTPLATSLAIYRNPMWDRTFPIQIINMYDIAIIKFPAGTSAAVAEIATTTPTRGDAFTIVGYGLNYIPDKYDLSINRASAGIKRYGVNNIDSVENGLIKFHGVTATTTADGSHACASKGDSGGPMFVRGKLVGVTSGGGKIPPTGESGRAFYVDLTTPVAQQFLQRFLW